MPFQKGNPGRPKGSLNKGTKAWKEFAERMATSPKVQKILQNAFESRPELILKVAEHAFGKPSQHVSVDGNVGWYVLPDGEDVAED